MRSRSLRKLVKERTLKSTEPKRKLPETSSLSRRLVSLKTKVVFLPLLCVRSPSLRMLARDPYIVSIDNRIKLIEELRKADVVILTYACDQPATHDRLGTYRLPELHRLEIKAPMIVVGCKLDLRDECIPVRLEDIMVPIIKEYRETETCIERLVF